MRDIFFHSTWFGGIFLTSTETFLLEFPPCRIFLRSLWQCFARPFIVFNHISDGPSLANYRPVLDVLLQSNIIQSILVAKCHLKQTVKAQ